MSCLGGNRTPLHLRINKDDFPLSRTHTVRFTFRRALGAATLKNTWLVFRLDWVIIRGTDDLLPGGYPACRFEGNPRWSFPSDAGLNDKICSLNLSFSSLGVCVIL